MRKTLQWLQLATFVVAALLAGLTGCHEATTSIVPASNTQGSAAKIAAEPSQAAPAIEFAEPPPDDLAGGSLVEETWDAIAIQSSPVGFVRTTVANVKLDGREIIRTCSFLRIVMHREGNPTTQEMTFASWDTPQGEFVKFESQIKAGPGQIGAVGTVKDGQLEINQSTLGQNQSVKIPWAQEWGGPFAVEHMLRRQPIKPGEKRSICCLLAALNVPGDVQLEALDYESIESPAGPQKLLKVRCVMDAGQHKIEEIRWLNQRGEAIKSLVPSLNQTAIRTTKHEALHPAAGAKPFDVMLASTVPVQGNLIPGPNTKRAIYRARIKDGPVAGLFSDCPSQRVKTIDDQTVELSVIALRPNSEVAGTLRVPSPAAEDSSANNFIQSNDPVITAMAAQIAPRESDAWRIAIALEKFVATTIRNKNFSQAFATAADVARTLEGDCSEHSVLMAALCRARNIPCRVTFGLIYHAPAKGFAFHMWNEAWINDRWIPLDPSWGLGGIGADHIKLGNSNLAGASPLADLLSVLQLFGRLELEVVSVE